YLARTRKAGPGRAGLGLWALRALPQLVGKAHLVTGRYHGCLGLVADGDLQLPVGVGQFGALDPCFALAADVDEDALGRDLDDAALHDLPDFQDRTGGFACEQGGEIFGVAHSVTLGAPWAG